MANPVTPAAPAAAAAPNPNPVVKPPAPGSAAAKPPPAAGPDFFEVPVNGVMKKYTRAEAEKMLSKVGYAEEAMRTAKQTMTEAQKLKQTKDQLKAYAAKDPEGFLRDYGVDPDQFIRSTVEKRVKQSEMTPEQLAIKERDDKIAAYEAREKQSEAKTQAQKQAAYTQQLQKQMISELSQATEGSGLDRTNPDHFAVLKDTIKEFYELGLPWDPHEVVRHATDRINEGFTKLEKAVLGGLTGQALEDRLGAKVVQAVKEHLVAKHNAAKGKPFAAAGSQTAPTPGPATKPSEYISIKQFRGGVR